MIYTVDSLQWDKEDRRLRTWCLCNSFAEVLEIMELKKPACEVVSIKKGRRYE